jgi:hypothetical protein
MAHTDISTMDLQFTQSQAHGLFWDSEVRQVVFGLPACINDTTKYDVCCENNKYDSNENISIKTSGNNNIDCGDILRFYDGDFDKKYTIILIRYKQNDDNKNICEILEIDYSSKLRDLLFGTIPREELEEYVNFIKSIPSGKAPKEIRDEYIKRKKNIQKKYDMKINISPKVDSNKQRRVQCSIPKTEQLLKKYPQFVLSKTTEPIVRGIQITPAIKSLKRVRHSKAMD